MSKVKLRQVGEEEVKDKGPEGLRDAGVLTLACSNCNAGLMNIWRTRPHEPQVWKVRANCPFCGDESFTTEVAGGFHNGPVAQPKDEEPDEDKALSTVVESFEIDGDTFKFLIRKASPSAKAIIQRR